MSGIQKHRFVFLLLVVLFAAPCASVPKYAPVPATADNGLVVASHPIAAAIGLRVLESGGNAVDAAVATGLALGVVDQFNSGIGGGGFVVIRMADGTVYAIDGRESAPAAADRDMYVRDGEVQSDLSTVGPQAVGVPGILAAYEAALEFGGTKPLDVLIEPSILVADNGFELDESYIKRYRDAVEWLRKDPASAETYFHQDGTPLEAGDVLRQPDLANAYRNIRDRGTDYFYRGEFAGILADYMREHGGLITREDMAGYTALLRKPIIGTYRDCEIIGMAPPSSGGVHVLQLLNMVEAAGVLAGKSGWDTQSIYWVSRFMSKVFEDRAALLGDPDFYPVPVERLTSKEYAVACVRAIVGDAAAPGKLKNAPQAFDPLPLKGTFEKGMRRLGRLTPEEDLGEGVLRLSSSEAFGHTTNLCVIDRWGNAVAVNQTVNLTYGAKITLPGTGVILNDEMDDFSAQPGVPNSFGLIGSEANSIAPGKRPLSSMAPTIVVHEGKPILVLGGAGGPVIITAVFETIVDVLDFGMTLAEAQQQPRFHQQYRPNVIIVEDAVPFWTRVRLLLMTHHPVVRSSKVARDTLGRVNAIAWDESNQVYEGLADPRAGRSAAAGY